MPSLGPMEIMVILVVALLSLAVALLALLLGIGMWNMRNSTPGNPHNGNPGHVNTPGLQINNGSVSPLCVRKE